MDVGPQCNGNISNMIRHAIITVTYFSVTAVVQPYGIITLALQLMTAYNPL